MDRIALSDRLRSGYTSLEFQTVPLKNLINEVWDRYRRSAEERRVKFRCACPPDLMVEVDSQMFGVALSNLVSNALKFTPNNTSVIVRAQQMEDKVEIKVFDQGPGLSPEALEKCFELYFSTVPPDGKKKGQGLGLFIAQLSLPQLLAKSPFSPLAIRKGLRVLLEAESIEASVDSKTKLEMYKRRYSGWGDKILSQISRRS